MTLSSAWTSISQSSQSSMLMRSSLKTILYSTPSSQVQQVANAEATSSTNTNYMNYGILVSSFTDGMASPSTQQFFKYSLASLLTMDAVQQTQRDIEETTKFSPCQGPDIDLLNRLEWGDALLEVEVEVEVVEDRNPKSREEKTASMMEYLVE